MSLVSLTFRRTCQSTAMLAQLTTRSTSILQDSRVVLVLFNICILCNRCMSRHPTLTSTPFQGFLPPCRRRCHSAFLFLFRLNVREPWVINFRIYPWNSVREVREEKLWPLPCKRATGWAYAWSPVQDGEGDYEGMCQNVAYSARLFKLPCYVSFCCKPNGVWLETYV
jgi:hypothetical protein